MTNRDILDELRVRGELVERLKRIAPRFREIINLRYGLSFETGLIVRGEMTIEQVAKLYSITTERVRQVEKNVFKKLSEGLTDSPWHIGTPTEEGEYVVWMRFPPDCTREEQGSLLVDWDKENGFTFEHIQVSKIGEVVAWVPIPHFEASTSIES